ncbi:hypothetical protein CGC20_36900 [Leishmania donovani]|uniref:Uncharacterized protein n=1 Tax=Leishmania donovani TaxID=5661 RepID=A0A504X1Y7_LEIDO|nr:hypothetical protein CGC20_36900 [Leishmania donovani]
MLSREQSPSIMIDSEVNSPTSSPTHSERNTRNGAAAPTSTKRESIAHDDLAAAEGPRNGIVLSKNGSRVPSQTNSIDAAKPRTASINSNGALQPTVTVPNLHLSGLQAQLRAASSTGGASASQARTSGAAARLSTASAATPAPSAEGAARPLSVPVARPAATVSQTPSASMPRATFMSGSIRRTGGSAGSKAFMPRVITAAPDYTAYPSDVSKYLKDVIRRREEALMFKLLPTAQLMDQAVLQAQAAYELIVQQEALEFLQICHKRKEQTETEIKEKLKTLVSLQPKLNIVSAVMAQLQDPASDCALLGALMMEEKQLQKTLKGDARYNKSKTAETDGGAVPYWWKQCVCSSFNVSAMLRQEPHRASIVDVSFATKTSADKKVIVVKNGEGNIVAWAHTRSGPDPNALAEAYLAAKPKVPELPANAYKGVLWPKEDAADVMRKAKAAKSPTADILPEVITILSYSGMGSFEMSKKDVAAVGEATS